jgi:hypothetical protein
MTAKILTASWFSKLPDTHIKIGISRGVPRGLEAGFRLYRALAPGSWWSRTMTNAEFCRHYDEEVLALLDPAEVVREILARAAGKTPVLCCFERPGEHQWCHRSLAAEWLAAHLGEVVPELGFEELAQRDHPMLPPAPTRAAAASAPSAGANTYIGCVAKIGRRDYRVLRVDPDNPANLIVSDGISEFSTPMEGLARCFGDR